MNSWVGERNGAHAKTLSALRVMRARPLRNFQPERPLDELQHLRAHKNVLELNLKGQKAAQRAAEGCRGGLPRSEIIKYFWRGLREI